MRCPLTPEDQTYLGYHVPIHLRQSTNLMEDILLVPATVRAYTATDGIGSAGPGGCFALEEDNPHGTLPRE